MLAGAACATDADKYSSYIGFILGTGMNAAYIQPDCDCCNIKKQIVVCESGKFLSVNRSDFDVEFDKTTVKPGTFFLEKLCSGAYLGPVSLIALKAAAKDGIFAADVAKKIEAIESLSLIEMDKFLHGPFNKECILGEIAGKASAEDVDSMFQILDSIVERSARYSAAILIACAMQTGAGKNASEPVCILCDGTTFFKTWRVKERVYGYLDSILTQQLGIYWNIVSCDNDITLGAAISGLID